MDCKSRDESNESNLAVIWAETLTAAAMESKLHQPHPFNEGNGAEFVVHMTAGTEILFLAAEVMSIRGGTGMVVQ